MARRNSMGGWSPHVTLGLPIHPTDPLHWTIHLDGDKSGLGFAAPRCREAERDSSPTRGGSVRLELDWLLHRPTRRFSSVFLDCDDFRRQRRMSLEARRLHPPGSALSYFRSA